jgi:hypothetical protein
MGSAFEAVHHVGGLITAGAACVLLQVLSRAARLTILCCAAAAAAAAATASAASSSAASAAAAAAAAPGPAITSEERVEERMAFKVLFYQVGNHSLLAGRRWHNRCVFSQMLQRTTRLLHPGGLLVALLQAERGAGLLPQFCSGVVGCESGEASHTAVHQMLLQHDN